MNPLVSVVMPVHNGGIHLAAAVDSILDQSYSRLQLILVDDHSSDAAISELDHFDPRLEIYPSNGRGVVSACNTGFSHSNGEFIARMDADDISLPFRIERQLEYLAAYAEVDIAGCRVEIFSEHGIKGGLQRYQDWLNSVCTPEQIHQQVFVESPLPNPGLMLRKSALRQLDGYREVEWPEDYDLVLRADVLGMQMGKPENVLLKWREHEQRLTHSDDRYSQAQFMRAKAHFLVRHRLMGQAVVIWGAGPTGRLLHDLIKTEGGVVDGFIEVHPRRIGGQKRGLPVWGTEKCLEAGLPIILVAVGAAGARQQIRAFMDECKMIEGEDYLFTA